MENSRKLKTVLLYCYAGGMFVFLLSYLWSMAIYDGTSSTPLWVFIGRFLISLLGIWLAKNWKNAVFQLFVLFSSLLIIRAVMRQGNTASDFRAIARTMLNCVWVWGGCYSLGFVLSKEQLKNFFKVFGAVWTAGIAFCALGGLYAAWMRIAIPNLSGEHMIRLWGPMDRARLEIIYLSTVSGGLMAVSVIIAVVCMLCFQKRWIKWLLGISTLPMLAALCLTDSRGAQVCVSAGLAVLAGLFVMAFQQKKQASLTPQDPLSFRFSARHWLLAAGGAAITFAVILLLLQLFNPAFDMLKKSSQNWPFLQSAAMSEQEPVFMSHRGYLGETALTGRDDIWRATLSYLRKNPKYLLIGKSFIDPMAAVNEQEIMPIQGSHCHNILLQVLLETGLPGFILLCISLFIIGKQTVRLIANAQSPLWQRAFSALIVVIGVGEMGECLTWMSFPFLPFLSILSIAAGCAAQGELVENRILHTAAVKHWGRQFLRLAQKLQKALPGLLRKLKPIFFIALALYAVLLPIRNDSLYAVIHQDDYDDPDRDLYYFCGDDKCSTHHGNHTIKTSGCGLCAIVNAVTYMTGEQIDVHEVAAFSRNNKHYGVHVGSMMTLYPAFAEEYGEKYHFSFVERAETLEEATEYLKQGCVAIAGAGNSRKGGGHLLVLANYNPATDHYLILDSAGNYASWSHSFSSWQAIRNGCLENNPDVFLTTYLIYSSPLSYGQGF